MSGDPREEVEKRLRESGFYDSPDEIRAHVDALAARVHGVTGDTDTIREALKLIGVDAPARHALAALDVLQARVAAADRMADALERIATFANRYGPSEEAEIARAALAAWKNETDA